MGHQLETNTDIKVQICICTRITGFNNLKTAQRLPNDSQTTAIRLPDDSLTLPDDCLTTA